MYNQMLMAPPPPPPPPPPPFTLFFNPSPLSSSSSLSGYPLPGVHPAATAPPSPLSHLRRCSQAETEPGMEALKSSLRTETASYPRPLLQHNQEEFVLVVEKGSLLGEGFVDELLNLGEFGENEKERDGNEEEQEAGAGDHETEQMETAGDCCNVNTASSSPPSSSALSYEGTQPLSEMSLPAHDAEELEWVSLIVDDSISEFPADAPLPLLAQNKSLCSVSTEAPVPPKAKRSRRCRANAGGWLTSLPFRDFASTTTSVSSSSSSSSSLSSYLIYHPSSAIDDESFLLYETHSSPLMKTSVPKKRGRKPKQRPAATGASGSAALHSERRCSHCGAQKTPQWRAGPLGAKTLCNACGVRYKSGRLLPEYRPACSPTYVESVHSSSHRKVLELRRQKEAELLQPVPTC